MVFCVGAAMLPVYVDVPAAGVSVLTSVHAPLPTDCMSLTGASGMAAPAAVESAPLSVQGLPHATVVGVAPKVSAVTPIGVASTVAERGPTFVAAS